MSRRRFWLLALLVAAALATIASPFASSSPDGLERVADDHSFAAVATSTRVAEAAPIPDYAFPGVADARIATAAAGLAGTLLVAALGIGVARAARRRPAPATVRATDGRQ